MIRTVLRIIVGIIFVVSGFVKAVDLKGFGFKLEEYFSPAVFNLPFLEPYVLFFAVAVVFAELLLGLLLIFRLQLKATLTLLIALCIFFGFLTFYSAYYNVVTDCGCFGDAVSFTPWQSFFKDMILLAALLLLSFLYRRKSETLPRRKTPAVMAVLALMLIFSSIMVWGIKKEPLIDFRDYKVGTNLLKEQQKIAADPAEYKTFYAVKNKQSGETRNIGQDEYINDKSYWQEGSPWEIQENETITKVVKKGYQSEIAKFAPEDANGQNMTLKILNAPRAVLILSYNPKEADSDVLRAAEAKAASETGTAAYGISTRTNLFTKIPNTVMDGTALKTIARSNPAVLILENGTIVAKLPALDYINL
ncbi:DoxX family protein [Chryseobacterium salipaludis]|uniref:BT_3928 family protein n=1 Tax=Chryseobacterium TaxID=59732 RepID=UPI001FF1CC8B|nr:MULTISPECIES: BT_3928 family protein [Chryseobacterium]MCJ8497938.1 DoxX family protein [Chryseobacterium salipaludis]MCX3296863.1 DoxX family protein [Planobacterium sp. JC490]